MYQLKKYQGNQYPKINVCEELRNTKYYFVTHTNHRPVVCTSIRKAIEHAEYFLATSPALEKNITDESDNAEELK